MAPHETSGAQLSATGLAVHYGRRLALSDVDLIVEPGSVTSVVGPNGAGKSTLLNSIAGLVELSAGQVLVDGIDITGNPAEKTFRRGVALVPEGKRVFVSLTVEENMRLAAAAFGSDLGDDRVGECLSLFPRLESRRKQRASYLSGGEQQQLMIARALVGSPRYLLLDEPSMGLSPQVVREVFQIIKRLSGDGVGILLVEQFVRQAVAISSHVHLLSRGRIARSFSGDDARIALASGDFFETYWVGARVARHERGAGSDRQPHVSQSTSESGQGGRTMTTFLQAVADAISSGSLYALIALGIALVFGVMRLVNIAYGEVIVASAFAAFYLQDYPLYVVLPGMLAAAIAVSVITERIAFRPLRDASPTTMLIASFAVSFILQNAALATVGPSPRAISVGSSLASSHDIGPLKVPGYSIVTVIAVVLIVVFLRVFLVKSPVGIGMRAASEDFDCARLIGVRANSVILVAFVLSGAIAAIVGFLLVSATGGITATSGLTPALLGFVSVVVGGMGSLPASALGGMVLGIFTVGLQYLLPDNLLVFRDAFLYTGVLLLLVWRPEGLFIRKSSVQARV